MNMEQNNPLVVCSGLTKTYGGFTALDHLDLTLERDYFRADYKALREELAQIPETLEGYSTESLDAASADRRHGND